MLATWRIWVVNSFYIMHLLHVIALLLSVILLIRAYRIDKHQPLLYPFTWITTWLAAAIDSFVMSAFGNFAETLSLHTTLYSFLFIIVPWIQFTAMILLLISHILSRIHYKRNRG